LHSKPLTALKIRAAVGHGRGLNDTSQSDEAIEI